MRPNVGVPYAAVVSGDRVYYMCGGQAGLWLGASIITLVKLILMLIPWVESLLVRVCGWRRRSHTLDASGD